MIPQLERVYLSQAVQECNHCLAAAQSFNESLHTQESTHLFDHAVNFIQHAAAASRIFWPPSSPNKISKERSKARGAHLRASLGLDENHALRWRTLRDHIEHFDERLDDWAEKSKYRNMVYRLIGSRDDVAGNAIEDGDIIHHLDPAKLTYSFRGEAFNLQEIHDGVEDLIQRINARLLYLFPERH